MNGKQAKRLRKAALGLAVVLSESGKEVKKDGYSVKVHDNKLNAQRAIAEKMMDNSTPATAKFEVQPSYQVLVRPDTMKGIYKRFKSGKV